MQPRALTGEGEKKVKKIGLEGKRKRKKKKRKKGEQEAGEKNLLNAFRMGTEDPSGRLVTDSHPCKDNTRVQYCPSTRTSILQWYL